MHITRVDTFILHVPVTRQAIADSTHQVTHWGAPGVILHTDTGLAGFGFAGTHAHLPTDRLITDCIAQTHAALLLEQDPHEVQWLWRRLAYFPPAQWADRSGITHLALAAVDIALWDLKAKAVGLPLWKFLGGSAQRKVEIYNTDGGWLNWPLDMLVADCKRLVEEEGFRGVKIKVGSPDPYDDLRRIEAVRTAIGPRVKLMVDANGRWDLPTAARIGRRFADFDVYWFEEPVWYDDAAGHAQLARQIATPIALGEQLGLLDQFRTFIAAGAVHYVQPDVTRLGGITEWWQVADLALAFRLPVSPHAGDMAAVQRHLSLAHPACAVLEYIPWLSEHLEEPLRVVDGCIAHPEQPGAGSTFRREAMENHRVG